MRKIILAALLLTAVGCQHGPQQKPTPSPKETVAPQASSFSGYRNPAQDNSLVNITHASPGGLFIGFFEEVTQDGSGFPVASFRIIDMKKNEYVFDKTMVNQDIETPGQNEVKAAMKLRRDLLILASDKIKELGLLDLSKNPLFAEKYVMLIKKYIQDQEYGQETFGTKDEILFDDKTYAVELKTVNATRENFVNQQNFSFCQQFTPKMYTVVVNGQEIHKDTTIPASRYCPFSYGLHMAYNINGRLLLFVRYQRPGFEGADYRTITVVVPKAK